MNMDTKDHKEKDKITPVEWKTFWESKVGKKFMNKLVDFKQSYLDSSMTMPQNDVVRMIDRAIGVEAVIQYIDVGIERAKKELKEEK
jgi:hypothetical protein